MESMSISPQRFVGTIKEKRQLTQMVYHFVIQNEKPTPFIFTPGQYATFIIDQKTRRQYSFCSLPTQSHFEVIVDIAPMGPGSTYFLEKQVGDRVEYLAPLGNFTLQENLYKKVFVATGTGIAPFRSMLLSAMETLHPQYKTQNNSPLDAHAPQFSLYWGMRYEDDMYWHEEFQALARQYRGFQYFLCLSKPKENWEKENLTSSRIRPVKGHVTDAVIENEKNLQNCEFYLCGNSAMINELKQRLSDLKVLDERVKMDMFY